MNNSYEIETIENPHPSGHPLYEGALGICDTIFGAGSRAKVEKELSGRNRSLLTVAHDSGKALGFKLGYEEKPDKFYSWLGGVAPEARKTGLGKALMQSQHDWCKKAGYPRIQTRTKNKWREMLILNLKSGFDIIGTYTDEEGEPKIILEKKL